MLTEYGDPSRENLAAVFGQVLGNEVVAPPMLTRGRSNDDVIQVEALDPGRRTLFGSAHAFAADDKVRPMLDVGVVRASVLPEAAEYLVIGGLPSDRDPPALVCLPLGLGRYPGTRRWSSRKLNGARVLWYAPNYEEWLDGPIDMLIVDGPAATRSAPLARYPASCGPRSAISASPNSTLRSISIALHRALGPPSRTAVGQTVPGASNAMEHRKGWRGRRHGERHDPPRSAKPLRSEGTSISARSTADDGSPALVQSNRRRP